MSHALCLHKICCGAALCLNLYTYQCLNVPQLPGAALDPSQDPLWHIVITHFQGFARDSRSTMIGWGALVCIARERGEGCFVVQDPRHCMCEVFIALHLVEIFTFLQL